MQESIAASPTKPAPFIANYAPQIYSGGRNSAARYERTEDSHLLSIQSRRTLRTTMVNEQGEIVNAKLNLEDGTTTPHEYKDYFPSRLHFRVKSEPTGIEPPWIRIPAAESSYSPSADKSRKKIINTMKMYLVEFIDPDEAVECIPTLDDLITGASTLDYNGNSRPMNRGLIFSLLRNLDMITAEAISEFAGCSLRHGQRLVQCLGIIIKEFNKIADYTYPQMNC